MKAKVEHSPLTGAWYVSAGDYDGCFSTREQAHSRACQIEGVKCSKPWVPDDPMNAIREALEWLDAHAPQQARQVLVAALEADANRSHPELPTPF